MLLVGSLLVQSLTCYYIRPIKNFFPYQDGYVAMVATVQITVVSRKYAPLPPPTPFTILAIVQNTGGGAYINAGCDNFSYDYALPFDKARPHCWWGMGGTA